MGRHDDTSALARGRRRLLALQQCPEYRYLLSMEAVFGDADETEARDYLRWALDTLVEQRAVMIATLRHLSPQQLESTRRFATELTLEPRVWRAPPRMRGRERRGLRVIRGGKRE